MRIVKVIWFDAQTSMNTYLIEEAVRELQPVLSESVGFLIHETKEYILLSFLNFGDELMKHWQVIPKNIIKNIITLKESMKKDV